MKLKQLFLLAGLLAPVLTGCGDEKRVQVKEIGEYFFEAPTYETLDYKFAQEYFAKDYDNWEGGCTSVSKKIDGEMMIGRNMDLNISYKAAYLIRTKTAGKHETFGLSYTFRDMSPDYLEAKEQGIKESFYKVLPFMCDDVVNDAGLHIEINMRHGECWPDGEDKYSYDHTNEEAEERVYVFGLCQYIALNCSSVAEAKEYVKTIDVYNKKDYWNYCFLVSDGNESSLLEPAIGTFFWTEADENGVNGQGNYYRNDKCSQFQDIKTGMGRLKSLFHGNGTCPDGVMGVTSVADMYKLMQSIQYSNYYLDFDTCFDYHFDPRSEAIGEFWGATYDFLMDPINYDTVRDVLNEVNIPIGKMTRDEKAKENRYWESSFTEVVLPKQKIIKVQLFEDPNKLYEISFGGVTKVNEIA